MKLLSISILFFTCTFFLQAQYSKQEITMFTSNNYSPQVKSWGFVRNIIGSNYNDIDRPLKDYGYKLEDSKAFKQGISYSYHFDKPNNGHAQTTELNLAKDYYTLVVKEGKVIGAMLEFIKGELRDDSDLRKVWTTFEKAFLADNYKKVDETVEKYGSTVNYRSTAQKTKIRVKISRENDVYSMAEVVISRDDVNIDAED